MCVRVKTTTIKSHHFCSIQSSKRNYEIGGRGRDKLNKTNNKLIFEDHYLAYPPSLTK